MIHFIGGDLNNPDLCKIFVTGYVGIALSLFGIGGIAMEFSHINTKHTLFFCTAFICGIKLIQYSCKKWNEYIMIELREPLIDSESESSETQNSTLYNDEESNFGSQNQSFHSSFSNGSSAKLQR